MKAATSRPCFFYDKEDISTKLKKDLKNSKPMTQFQNRILSPQLRLRNDGLIPTYKLTSLVGKHIMPPIKFRYHTSLRPRKIKKKIK